jgi:RNAse (barnase) inhibitor barstar
LSIFKLTPKLSKKIDYQIVKNGWLQLYLSNGTLENDISWLESEGYEIIQFNCISKRILLDQFKKQFQFPTYFHNSLDSLADCLEDIEVKGIGMALILKKLDTLKKEDSDSILDILINVARLKFIIGKRVLILGQVNDRDFKAVNIGAITISLKG